MEKKQIPLVVMLTAGAVASITARLMHYDLEATLWIVLLVLIVFYIVGCVLKRTIEKFEAENKEREEAEAAVSDEGEVIEKDASGETSQEDAK